MFGVSYNTLKKRTDIQHKLRQNIRKRLYGSIILGIRTPALIGCSIDKLKTHLESKFTHDMDWTNYGKVWEIDHILPLASFDLLNIQELTIASNFNNLQPLLVADNRRKSSRTA